MAVTLGIGRKRKGALTGRLPELCDSSDFPFRPAEKSANLTTVESCMPVCLFDMLHSPMTVLYSSLSLPMRFSYFLTAKKKIALLLNTLSNLLHHHNNNFNEY